MNIEKFLWLGKQSVNDGEVKFNGEVTGKE